MYSILLINIFCSFFLCGVIWVVQIVHYPFFHRAGRERFISHMSDHKLRISLIVMPFMLAELSSSFYLSFFEENYALCHQAGLAVVIMVWLVTFVVSVPIHEQLSQGYRADVVNRLVRTNWIRTLLWTLKSILGLWLLYQILSTPGFN
jgi:hypothetical protein